MNSDILEARKVFESLFTKDLLLYTEYKTLDQAFDIYWQHITTIVFPKSVCPLPFIIKGSNILLKPARKYITIDPNWKFTVYLEMARLYLLNTNTTSCLYPYLFTHIDPIDLVNHFELHSIRSHVYSRGWDFLLPYLLCQRYKQCKLDHLIRLWIDQSVPMYTSLPTATIPSEYTILQIQRFLLQKMMHQSARLDLSNSDANLIIFQMTGIHIGILPFQELEPLHVKDKVALLKQIHLQLFEKLYNDKCFSLHYKNVVTLLSKTLENSKTFYIYCKLNRINLKLSQEEILNIIRFECNADRQSLIIAKLILDDLENPHFDEILTHKLKI